MIQAWVASAISEPKLINLQLDALLKPAPAIKEDVSYQGTDEDWDSVIELLRREDRDIEEVYDSLKRTVDDDCELRRNYKVTLTVQS